MTSYSHSCSCGNTSSARRTFLAQASCALAAALAASGLGPRARALPVDFVRPIAEQDTERAYPLPASDGVNIDQDNEVILVRSANRVYAFSLSCPHENTALRWRQQDLRFQCPRHESKYQPDGSFVSGRATRNMDRFAIRRDNARVVVNLVKLFRSDQQKAEWDAALLSV
jgi:nitrite reductase/ring-hydroxylating ferredoxin subunit